MDGLLGPRSVRLPAGATSDRPSRAQRDELVAPLARNPSMTGPERSDRSGCGSRRRRASGSSVDVRPRRRALEPRSTSAPGRSKSLVSVDHNTSDNPRDAATERTADWSTRRADGSTTGAHRSPAPHGRTSSTAVRRSGRRTAERDGGANACGSGPNARQPTSPRAAARSTHSRSHRSRRMWRARPCRRAHRARPGCTPTARRRRSKQPGPVPAMPDPMSPRSRPARRGSNHP